MWYLTGEKNGYLFGVKQWKEESFEKKSQELIKEYHKNLRRWGLGMLLLILVTCIPSHFSLVLTGQILWVFAVCVVMLVPFGKANQKMKEWKREYRILTQGEGEQKVTAERFVDVTAAGSAKPKFFVKSTAVAAILGFIPALLEVLLKDKFFNPEAPDFWIMELLLIPLALIALLCLACVNYYNRQGVKVLTMSSQVNIQINRVQQYQWGRFWAAMACISTLYTFCMWASLHILIEEVVWVILIVTFVYSVLVIGMGIRCWLVIRKTCAKYLQSEEALPDDSEEEYWIWGLFYYNKQDQRFLVEKRVGIGMSCNMARPASKILAVTVIAGCLLLVLGCSIYLILDEFTPVYLNYQNGRLESGQWKEEYTINGMDVASVTLMEEAVNMSRRAGTSMDTVKKGDFFSREYERGFDVCFNPQETPFLMIETKEGEWYFLGDSSGETTKEIYKQLLLEIEK